MKADFVVVGGGPAGFGAAIRAAQKGIDTLVIERFGCPGGTMTTGFMCALKPYSTSPLETELAERLRNESVLFDAFEGYPQAIDNPLVHSSGRINFPADIGAYVMVRMMEERGVRFLFRTLCVDTIVTDKTIEAVVVENASGRQAIKGKVFVDATGRGDVAARSGVPFKSPGCQDEACLQLTGEDKMGFPVPASLMWKLSGVNFESLFEYQKDDPNLKKQIVRAGANGDIPDSLFRPNPENVYAARYKGHPFLDMCPLAGGPGEMLVWGDVPYEWGLNCAESGEDASRAEVEMRKQRF